MPAKRKPAARKSKSKAKAVPRASHAAASDGLSAVMADLAVLTAANNLMAQTAFLTMERMRLSTEVVDERISNEAAAALYERCEQMARASDDVILRLLDRAGARDERADRVRAVVGQRRELGALPAKPAEQTRLLESLERMYR